MAIQIVRELEADVFKRGTSRAVYAKQFDSNSRFLKVRIKEDGKEFKVDSSVEVLFNVERSDGLKRSVAGSVNADGTVLVPLTKWMLETKGKLACDISLVEDGEDGARLTTMKFYVEVEEAAVPEGYIFEGDEAECTHTEAIRYANEIPPVCEVNGSRERITYCTICNAIIKSETESIEAEGHTFIAEVIAPTTTAQGYTKKTCTVCGLVVKTDFTSPSQGFLATFNADGYDSNAGDNFYIKSSDGKNLGTVTAVTVADATHAPTGMNVAALYFYAKAGTGRVITKLVVEGSSDTTEYTAADLASDAAGNLLSDDHTELNFVYSVLFPLFEGKSVIATVYFEEKYSGENVTYIGEGQTEIATSAYAQKDYLTNVVIVDGVTSIGIGAFTSCHNLETVTIPNSVTTIKARAFQNCIHLSRVNIGSGVTMILASAFESCTAITDVYYSGTESQWSSILIADGNTALKNATIHYDS